jgi:hypothetical protein
VDTLPRCGSSGRWRCNLDIRVVCCCTHPLGNCHTHTRLPLTCKEPQAAADGAPPRAAGPLYEPGGPRWLGPSNIAAGGYDGKCAPDSGLVPQALPLMPTKSVWGTNTAPGSPPAPIHTPQNARNHLLGFHCTLQFSSKLASIKWKGSCCKPKSGAQLTRVVVAISES